MYFYVSSFDNLRRPHYFSESDFTCMYSRWCNSWKRLWLLYSTPRSCVWCCTPPILLSDYCCISGTAFRMYLSISRHVLIAYSPCACVSAYAAESCAVFAAVTLCELRQGVTWRWYCWKPLHIVYAASFAALLLYVLLLTTPLTIARLYSCGLCWCKPNNKMYSSLRVIIYWYLNAAA